MLQSHHPVLRLINRIWRGLIEPAKFQNPKERHLARILNIVLIFFLILGAIYEIQYNPQSNGSNDYLVVAMLLILALAYYLNQWTGKFLIASTLTVSLFAIMTFLSALAQFQAGDEEFSVLYYLIVVILMSEFFFSMRGFVATILIVMTGTLLLTTVHMHTENIFLFLLVFSGLVAFSSYNRRSIENEQIELAGKLALERTLLTDEKRRTLQLNLLEEVSIQIAKISNPKEILDVTIQAIVEKFGYAEVAISLLVDGNILEAAAISGTQDFGYRAGYRQKIGDGIIGHVAKIRKHYLTNNVARDPFYYSTAERDGSALGVPMLDRDTLLGVIYVESTLKNYFDQADIQTLQTLANHVAITLQKARLYARTQEHLQVMMTLQAISQAAMTSLELEEILDNVIRLLKRTFDYTHISIYLLEENELKLATQIGYPDEMVIHKIPIHTGIAGLTVRTKRTQFIPDVTKEPAFLRAAHEVQSEICVPLLKNRNVIGILNVESGPNTPLDENDVDMLNALAGIVAIAIDNARLHAQVKAMALTDAVSGLYNRHAFEELLAAEIERSSRYNHPFSLIIFDIDSFKEYNDTWGHPAGDKRLKATAELIRTHQRIHDIAARYGGDEFAIILPNTDDNGARQFAQRLHEAARASTTQTSSDGHVVAGFTLSMGHATYPGDGKTIEVILHAADQAELVAKKQGKNRIIAAAQPKKQ